MTVTAPTVQAVKVTRGIAGQVVVTATVDHGTEHGGAHPVCFVGTTYGTPGPVVMITGQDLQAHVTDPGRFGPVLDEAWVRAFFA